MQVGEMTQDACRAVLTRNTIGRLGCSLENRRTWFQFVLHMRLITSTSFRPLVKKIEWMRANPKVCMEIDEITNRSQWVSVIAYGLYQEFAQDPI